MFWHLRDMEKLAEGIEIGRQEALEELREEGREEMRQEVRQEFAINMLPDFDDDVIAKYSKLSIEEVARIREEHSN